MTNILRAALGILFFLVIAWLLSSNKRRINLRIVAGGLFLQILLALIILQTDVGRDALDGLSRGVTKFLKFSEQGSEFVFGPLTTMEYTPPVDGTPQPLDFYAPWDYENIPRSERAAWPPVFAFRALPTIIYFSAIMGILYHLGVVQFVVRQMARVMMFLMRVSGAESLAVAANVFVGQTEAPLVVRPYIATMTRSELMALMTGGFATIAGSVLAAYIGFLGEGYAGHLLAASFMSAPAAFVIAKVMIPETEVSQTGDHAQAMTDRTTTNVLDAAASGTSDGLKLYLNVLAMLIAFVAIIKLINWPLGEIDIASAPLSLERLFGWVFAPVAWMMGVDWADCTNFGSLLGVKIAANEFVAYGDLASYNARELMSPRSRIMAAYALCGFANFASIGIQIGGISPLAPNRRKDLSRLALRAMLGGAFASWMTATIAGAFIDG